MGSFKLAGSVLPYKSASREERNQSKDSYESGRCVFRILISGESVFFSGRYTVNGVT